MKKRNITTKEEARAYAVEWQQWASEQDLSYKEVSEWSCIFDGLAERFDLEEEFKESGII